MIIYQPYDKNQSPAR